MYTPPRLAWAGGAQRGWPPSPCHLARRPAGIQGPLGRMLGGGHGRFQTSRWQDKDCPVPAKVRAGPGSGQRPEVPTKEVVDIHSQGRKRTDCQGGAGTRPLRACPVAPADRSPGQEVRSRKGVRLLLGGCLPVPPPGPSWRLPGGPQGVGVEEPGAVGSCLSQHTHEPPLSVPAWCTGPWECTPSLSGPRAPGIRTSHRCHSSAHTNVLLGMLLPAGNFYSALRTQLDGSSWIKLFLKHSSPALRPAVSQPKTLPPGRPPPPLASPLDPAPRTHSWCLMFAGLGDAALVVSAGTRAWPFHRTQGSA